jgi:hypothetical protein
MKIIRLIKLLSLLLFSTISFAQKKASAKKCVFDKVFTKCETPPTFGNDSLELQKYFLAQFKQQLTNSNGKITIHFYIDKQGKTCCESFDDQSNLNLSKNQLFAIIDTMPNWNSGIQNGNKVDCISFVVLTFKENTLLVESAIGIKSQQPAATNNNALQ